MGLNPGSLVGELRDALLGADPEMVPAFGDNHLVVGDLLVEKDLPRDRILGVKAPRDVLFSRFVDRVSGLSKCIF